MFNFNTFSIGRAAMAVLLVQLAGGIPAKEPTEPATPASQPAGAKSPPQNSTAKLFDFKLTPDMKDTDFDDEKSALSKLIKFVVKGKGSRSEYLSLVNSGSFVEMGISIKNDSIFVPGEKIENTQNGFKRTDVLPAVDATKAFTGVTTFYQSIRLDPKGPLNLTHSYLLASIELPGGDHVFDIVTGTDFDSQNTSPKETAASKTIRVRDLKTKTLHQLPLTDSDTFNFAVTVDWKANMLTVYASTNNEPLKKVSGPMANDPKAANPADPTLLEFHSQLLKQPLPNPADPAEKRKDTPHFGLQPLIKTPERVFFSNVFVTSGSEIITSVAGPKGGKASSPNCKPKGKGTTKENKDTNNTQN